MHAATRRMLNCMYMDRANANAHDFARSFAFARLHAGTDMYHVT